MTPQCAVCAKPLADGSTVCVADARDLAKALTAAAGHAEDAWTVIARQARYGVGGGARQVETDAAIAEDLRRNRVTAFAWAASIERPPVGGLRPEPLPVNIAAVDEYRAAENTITTWARDLYAEMAGVEGLPACCRWLAAHVEQLRHHAGADEAFDELRDACRQLERLVDRPASDRRLVGVCDCGAVLYARYGQTVIQCGERTCGMTWDVERSREILIRHLDGRLLTAAEAARMAAYLDPGRTTEQIRILIASWAKRGQVAVHGRVLREPTDAELSADPDARPVQVPTYLFGEVRARLAETPRRQRDGAAA